SDLQREAGRQLLSNYLQAPQPATLLVFAHKHKVLDARTALSKLLAQKAIVVNTKKLQQYQVPTWIKEYVQAQHLDITEKAAWMLQEFIGNDLGRLAKELDKLQLNLGQGKCIDDSLVQTYVGISKTYNAFELQKALAQKDVRKATQIIQYFEANPKANPAIPLIALLFSFFSKLLLVHQAPHKTEEALAPELRVRSHFVGEYLKAARHYTLSQVIANIHHLHQADLQLKGINYPTTPEGQILKELIYKLLH
ncbi:MAG: DNA polymerase III subunit delta, partial [Bacteroidota bacterium]